MYSLYIWYHQHSKGYRWRESKTPLPGKLSSICMSRDEHKLKAFGNRVLRRIFGRKSEGGRKWGETGEGCTEDEMDGGDEK